MRWIYISPHFDDAVLSCGGLIWEQAHAGIAAEIWTVCAGEPPTGPVSNYASRMHETWKSGTPRETLALRRIEDQNAARRVGATTAHLSIPDAIYRRTNTGSLLYPDNIFLAPNPREQRLADEIARELASNLTQYDTVVCPLALGGHVDHRMTRLAVERLNRPLWYYADIPYYFREPPALAAATQSMSGKVFQVSPEGVAAWQDGIAVYASQLSSLFDDEAAMRRQIRAYAQENGGLQLWELEGA